MFWRTHMTWKKKLKRNARLCRFVLCLSVCRNRCLAKNYWRRMQRKPSRVITKSKVKIWIIHFYYAFARTSSYSLHFQTTHFDGFSGRAYIFGLFICWFSIYSLPCVAVDKLSEPCAAVSDCSIRHACMFCCCFFSFVSTKGIKWI